jgi:predicted site-specific integrase-resolvase
VREYFSHMTLTDCAKETGLSYVTAWRLFRAGKLPVRATQLETGTILVHPEPVAKGRVALYTPRIGHVRCEQGVVIND